MVRNDLEPTDEPTGGADGSSAPSGAPQRPPSAPVPGGGPAPSYPLKPEFWPTSPDPDAVVVPGESTPSPAMGPGMFQPKQMTLEQILQDIYSKRSVMGVEAWRDYVEDIALDLYVMGWLPGGMQELFSENNELSQEFLVGVKKAVDNHATQIAVGSKRASVMGWREYLDENAGAPSADQIDGFASGSGGGTKAPLTITLGNAKTLEAILENQYRRMVGKKPSEAEKRAFVATVHQAQKATQAAAYSLRDSGGTTEQMADPTVLASEFAKQERPTEVAAKETVNAGSVLRGMI